MAWYKTGTVAVTNASTTVTGTGTNFVSGAQVGDGFLGPNELLYEITAINSATSLTIAPAYGGATASSQSYAIAPTQGLVASLASDVTDLITDYQSVVDNAGAGKFGDGSAASPAIRFTNDQDTGFFRDTANEIAFATAGVKRGEFTSSGIQLLDGQKFIAGTGSDLSIFHNGTNSFIEDSGDGGLTIRSNLLTVQNAAGNETVAQFVEDGFVKLFHNNSQVFTTISSGASITGSLGIGTSAPVFSTGGGVEVSHASSANLRLNSDAGGAAEIRHGTDLTIETRTAEPVIIGTNATERMRIDSSGNVGIGNTSSGYLFTSGETRLAVGDGSEHAAIQIYSGTAKWGGLEFADDATNGTGQGFIGYYHPSDYMQFNTSGSEAMRIDSSGNLLVGTTSATVYTSGSGGDAGVNLRADGQISNSSNSASVFNRMGSDGPIHLYYKNGTSVGSIESHSSGGIILDGGGAVNQTGFWFSNPATLPVFAGALQDNRNDLGSNSYRFDDIYATNATIQTSDRNEKQDIAELTDAEQRVAVAAKGLLRKFRWKDAVAEKGDEARTHFGIIAQDLQAVFAAEGLDAGDYAMFISSTWTDEETGEERTRMGVRYSELLAFIIAAI